MSARHARRRERGRVLGRGHRHRHRAGGPGADLRGVHPDRQPAAAPREGHRPRPAALPQARRAARRPRAASRASSGVGSTFTAVIPIIYEPLGVPRADLGGRPAARAGARRRGQQRDAARCTRRCSRAPDSRSLAARTLREARDALAPFRPRAIILDILLQGEDTWDLLTELKRRPDLRDIPVAVVTTVEDERKAIALGADAYCVQAGRPPAPRSDCSTPLAAPETMQARPDRRRRGDLPLRPAPAPPGARAT